LLKIHQHLRIPFETATNSRSKEMEALAKARAVISEKTCGAESFSCLSAVVSFSALIAWWSGHIRGCEEDRELAKSEHAPELAQLASRVASAMHAES